MFATNNFAEENLIGKVGFRNVYKGKIVHGKGQVWKKISMLSLYKHENLVHPLKFCDEKIVVWGYTSKRTPDLEVNSNYLTSTQGLKMCIVMARGTHSMINRVSHRDIKSSNILLDENLKTKSDSYQKLVCRNLLMLRSSHFFHFCRTYNWISRSTIAETGF